MNDALASRSFLFDKTAARHIVEASPSLELTASDGTGLTLVSIDARVVVDDPLAFTELVLTFENPLHRQLEGRFRIALPGGASVSRFAMRIGSSWQEGEVVERQAARRAYEDFLHRKQDPALLEHEAGNEFSARVFPIEAREKKELILSYSHELVQPGAPYRLPLVGLPLLGSLSIRAIVGRAGGGTAASSLGGTTTSTQVVEVQKSHWKPDVDFELIPPASGRMGMRHEDLALVRVTPSLPAEPDEVRSLLVLIDTSASRALGHEAQRLAVADLLAGLARGAGPAVPLAVACFDQAVTLIFEGTAGGFSPAKLDARLPLGASDLVGALRWVAARKQAPRYERLLLVTDGIGTAGDADPEALVTAVRALGGAGVERLDVLAVGGIRDDGALRRLVTAGLARDGIVCEGDRLPHEIAERLVRATRSGISVQVPGASWVWPTRLDGVQPGEAALVYAELPRDKPLGVVVGGAPMALPPGTVAQVERPLLERAWVKARIDKLEDMRAKPDTDRDVREGMLRQVVDLSVKHRVLSAHTALLVLESERDYALYKIDRRALADILTVGLGGVEVLHRKTATLPQAQPARREAPAAPMAKFAAAEVGMDEELSAMADLGEESIDPSAIDSLDAPLGAVERAAEPVLFSLGGLMELEQARAAADGDEVRSIAASAPMAEPPRPPPAPAPAPARRVDLHASHAAAPPAAQAPAAVAPAAARPQGAFAPSGQPGPAAPPPPSPLDAWDGRFREVMALLLAGQHTAAMTAALSWRASSPGDVLALVALGEAAEALGDVALAVRAYGSLIDLFPSRADLRRFAGERLARLGDAGALSLAIDTYARAVESRPDHPSGHRLLAMALLRAGRYAEAFEAIARGQAQSYPPKFPGVERILAEDLALCAAALVRAEPSRRDEIMGRLRTAGAKPEDKPSLRFVLVWETDANDVDFHIHDARGGHAYYSQKQLPSGGELYADVTQGYGPECFTIRAAPGERAYPYRLQAHYFSRGPMGYGMGALQIVEHDGAGRLVFEERPYIVMHDRAFVDLGVVSGPLTAAPAKP